MKLIIDGHNDLPWRLRARHGSSVAGLDSHRPGLHTDLPRLRAGGVGAQFWSVYVPSDVPEPQAFADTCEQIDLVRRMVAAYPADLAMAYTADDVEHAVANGRIASLLGVEGGHCLTGSPGALRTLARLGVRYVTLTHNHHTAWADSAAHPPVVGGLTAEGRAIVREMQRLGVLVDLSPGRRRSAGDLQPFRRPCGHRPSPQRARRRPVAPARERRGGAVDLRGAVRERGGTRLAAGRGPGTRTAGPATVRGGGVATRSAPGRTRGFAPLRGPIARRASFDRACLVRA